MQDPASDKQGMGRPYRKVTLEWGCVGFLGEGWGEWWVGEVLQGRREKGTGGLL